MVFSGSITPMGLSNSKETFSFAGLASNARQKINRRLAAKKPTTVYFSFLSPYWLLLNTA